MKSPRFFSLFPVITTLFLFHLNSIPTVQSSNPKPSAQTTNTDFIRTSCSATLYPDLCFTSLAGYASAIKNDPARLARAAIGISLSRANHMSVYLSNISTHSDSGLEPRASAAVHDCSSVFSDAVDQIRSSLRQMKRLGKGAGSLQFQLSNVQTWMSAALTNEDTCTDGFDDAEDTKLKLNVCNMAGKVKAVTSNALALVNSYVFMVTSP